MKKIIKVVFNSVLVVIIGILAWFLYNFKTYIVISGSMEPVIKTKELIVVKKHGNHYKKGDIVSFHQKGIDVPITHRIVDYNEKEGYYTTKGDNNNVKDKKKLLEKNIIGKVVFQSYFLGSFFMKYYRVLYLITSIVIILCILDIIFRRERQ